MDTMNDVPSIAAAGKPLRVDQPHIPPPRWFTATFAANGTFLIMSNFVQGFQTVSVTAVTNSSSLIVSTVPNNPTVVNTTNPSISTATGIGGGLLSSVAVQPTTTTTINGSGFAYSFHRSPVSLYSNEATKILLPYSRHYEELLFRLSLVGRYHEQAIQQRQQPLSGKEGHKIGRKKERLSTALSTGRTDDDDDDDDGETEKQGKKKKNEKNVNRRYRYVTDSDEESNEQASLASSISDIVSETNSSRRTTETTTVSTGSRSSSFTSSSSVVHSDDEGEGYRLRQRRKLSYSLSEESFTSSVMSPSEGEEGMFVKKGRSSGPESMNVSRSNDYSMIASDVHEVTNDLQSLFHIQQQQQQDYTQLAGKVVATEGENRLAALKGTAEDDDRKYGYDTASIRSTAKTYPMDDTVEGEEMGMNLVRRPGLGLQKGIVTLALIEGHSNMMEELTTDYEKGISMMKNLFGSCLPYLDNEGYRYRIVETLAQYRIAHAQENNFTEVENIWRMLVLASETMDRNRNIDGGSFLWDPIVFHSLQYFINNGYLQDAVLLNEVCKEDYVQRMLIGQDKDRGTTEGCILPSSVTAVVSLYAKELEAQYRVTEAVTLKKGLVGGGRGKVDDDRALMVEEEEKKGGTNELKCSLCDLGVKGLAVRCMICGHGGHHRHMKEWFTENSECPEGCGCFCVVG